VVVNREPIVPLSIGQRGGRYPSMDAVTARLEAVAARVIVVDAARVARDAGDPRTASVAMLGILSGLRLVPVDEPTLRAAVERRCPPRVLEVNQRAFALGVGHGADHAQVVAPCAGGERAPS